MKTKYVFHVLLLTSAIPLSVTAQAPRDSRPPNIVFILADDFGWADLSCYGSTYHETPNLDRLARQGMRFTNAYAACPVCSPTRASILTGRYPAHLNLTDWIPGRGDRPDQKLKSPAFNQQLPLEELTIAEALKPAGYTAASIGKWHLGAAPSYLPTQQGFDVNIAGTRRGSPPGYFYPYARPNRPEFALPGLRAGGTDGEYLTDRLAREAARFIRENKDRPFFLYLSHFTVHIPIQPKPALLEKYQAKGIPERPHNNPHYAAMVQSLDESVGLVLETLDDLNLSDRTVVIFTSDNGGLSTREGRHTPATSNAPLRAGKGHLHEGGIREPLIVRWPGVVEPGSVSDTPVTSVDFFPTIVEITGAQAKPARPIDGVSLVPLLRQTGPLPPRALFWHYPHYSNQGGRPGAAIRDGDYKLIEFYEDNKLELYNLATDIGETRNLAAQMPQRAKELRDRLDTWRKRMGAQIPTRKPTG